MGIFSKLAKGGKTFLKVHVKCINQDHSQVVLVATKDKDLIQKLQEKDIFSLEKILGRNFCDKCSISIDVLEDEKIKAAKKVFNVIEK